MYSEKAGDFWGRYEVTLMMSMLEWNTFQCIRFKESFCVKAQESALDIKRPNKSSKDLPKSLRNLQPDDLHILKFRTWIILVKCRSGDPESGLQIWSSASADASDSSDSVRHWQIKNWNL